MIRSRKATPSTPALLLAAIFMAVAASHAAAAAPPQVALSLAPASVDVPPEGNVTARLIIDNSSPAMLRNLELSSFTDAGVGVVIDPPRVAELGPGSAVAWKLVVSRAQQGRSSGAVNLLLRYVSAPASAGPTSRLATATLAVRDREPEAVDKLADVVTVELKTALASLQQFRPGELYVVVTNVSNRPVTVEAVQPRESASLVVKADSAGSASQAECQVPVIVQPRDMCVFPFQVDARDTVQPGKHLIVIDITAAWEQHRGRVKGRQVVSHEVDVGVFGESALLTAFGIPSFLVLPGFLMVGTFGLLWTFVSPRKQFPLAAKDANFWLVAIGLSFLVALLYPWVTRLAGPRRSYLEGYGLKDVVYVWVGSTATAIVFFLLVRTVSAILVGLEARRTPSANDDPIELLRKLGRQKLGVYRPRVEIAPPDAAGNDRPRPEVAFLLQPKWRGEPRVWVGSKILLSWSAVRKDDAEVRDLKTRIQALIKPMGDVNKLAALLAEGRHKVFDVEWEKSQRPRPVDGAAIKKAHPENALVEEREPGETTDG